MTKANKKQLIELAFTYARKSGDPHLKVGAVLVEKYNIASKKCFQICQEGYNHLPKSCENMGYKDQDDKTRPEVIHAEAHALSYLMKDQRGRSLTHELFCTLSPCMECAKLIHLSGIKKIYFYNYYKDLAPLEFLRKCGVKYEQVL